MPPSIPSEMARQASDVATGVGPPETPPFIAEHRPMTDVFSQHPYRCRLEWGPEGARRGAERGDILVIVDTLSFSTTVVTAVREGGLIYPCGPDEDPAPL